MGIKIDWSDPNAADDYTIYRSSAPIADGALPAALATLPAGSLTYTDDTAVRNQLYYYRVASRKGTDTALTPNKALAYMPYTGPGPQALLRGDWSFGYFGRVAMSDVFTVQECRNFLGNPAGMTDGAVTEQYWLKFAYKGKILFIASQVLLSSVTWEAVYRAGLIYGNFPSADWAVYAKTTFGTIPQGRQVVRGDHTFNIRTPTSRAVMSSNSSTPADQMGGEYDLIIAYAYNTRAYPDTLGFKQLDDLNNNGTWASFSTDLQTNFCLNRGTGNVPDGINTSLGVSSPHGAYGWRPLLELIL